MKKREKQFDFSDVTSLLSVIFAYFVLGNILPINFLVNEMTKIAAADTLIKAAKQGDPVAQFSLGVCYQNGWVSAKIHRSCQVVS